MMTARQVMYANLKMMTLKELQYAYAYCEWKVKEAAENGPVLQRWDARRVQIETEIAGRNNEARAG